MRDSILAKEPLIPFQLEIAESMNSILIADANEVAQLLEMRSKTADSYAGSAPLSERPRRAGEPPKLPRRVMGDRCKCRLCPKCRDNARWDRIFQEKFADPDYYSLRPVRQSSALDSLG
jgi:hypothetical protein